MGSGRERQATGVVHRGWGKKAAGSDAAEVEARLAAEEAAATAPDTP
ncbi:hypothetical protein [Streptomyces lavendulae]